MENKMVGKSSKKRQEYHFCIGRVFSQNATIDKMEAEREALFLAGPGFRSRLPSVPGKVMEVMYRSIGNSDTQG